MVGTVETFTCKHENQEELCVKLISVFPLQILRKVTLVSTRLGAEKNFGAKICSEPKNVGTNTSRRQSVSRQKVRTNPSRRHHVLALRRLSAKTFQY